MFSLMSLMYSKKSIVPRTEPCGTPDVTYVVSDRQAGRQAGRQTDRQTDRQVDIQTKKPSKNSIT